MCCVMLRPKCWSHACSGCKASEGAKALAGIVGTSACWVICGAFLHAILDQQLGVSDVLRLLEAKQQNCELHARAGGSGLLWFTHQTVQIASTRSLPKSVRSQKRYARMKEFKRFCIFFFINKVIQVILVYTWICLSLPNGHIRATKMNIYILELGYPIFRPTYVCHCQNNSKHG